MLFIKNIFTPIKVWYKNENSALKERAEIGLSSAETMKCQLNDRVPSGIGGTVNPICGLRGDAKELWSSVRAHDENRVQLRR